MEFHILLLSLNLMEFPSQHARKIVLQVSWTHENHFYFLSVCLIYSEDNQGSIDENALAKWVADPANTEWMESEYGWPIIPLQEFDSLGSVAQIAAFIRLFNYTTSSGCLDCFHYSDDIYKFQVGNAKLSAKRVSLSM